MRKMMEEHLVAHKDPLDESVKLEELRNPTSAVASTAETPYEVVLEKTGPQSWKASTILGKRNFALVKADSKTSSDIQEAYRQFVIHTYGRDKGKAIVRSLFTDDPHETTILLVCSAKIAGLYRVTGNYINRVYVDPDYRGQGAVDVMIEDIEARVLNGERDKKVRYRVIREHRRANQGYNEGALEKFKQDLGVRSIVRVASARSSSSGAADALKILPYEWHDSDLNMGYFIAELSRLLQIENILEQDKSAFVFSEKVTFDNGLGVLLPKLAKSGMRVAVIATNDMQRALIDELNQGKPENERISYADTIADIRTKVHTARYYYFKVTGDPNTDLRGIITFDITEIVKKIIDAIGKVAGIIEYEKLDLLHQAAQKFTEAA